MPPKILDRTQIPTIAYNAWLTIPSTTKEGKESHLRNPKEPKHITGTDKDPRPLGTPILFLCGLTSLRNHKRSHLMELLSPRWDPILWKERILSRKGFQWNQNSGPERHLLRKELRKGNGRNSSREG